jgi:hypothetical protein
MGLAPNSCLSQITNLKDRDIIEKTTLINIYKKNQKLPDCASFKTALFMEGGKIPSCFLLKKELNTLVTKRIIKIFLNKKSFQKPSPECFSTDFGMILFDSKKRIIGNIALSSVCNNLSLNGAMPFTLTDKANSQLLEIFQ